MTFLYLEMLVMLAFRFRKSSLAFEFNSLEEAIIFKKYIYKTDF